MESRAYVDGSPLNVLSLCSGVGLLDRAFHRAFPNSRTVCYVEREAYACAVLAQGMARGVLDAAPVWSDLDTFDCGPWAGLVDVVIAGLPCQPYSLAGKQRGHADERAIWPQAFRIIDRLQPAVVFLENVPGQLKFFQPMGERLSRMGYRLEAGLFTAEERGASHQRKRFFVLAVARHFGGRSRMFGAQEGIGPGSNGRGSRGTDQHLAIAGYSDGRIEDAPELVPPGTPIDAGGSNQVMGPSPELENTARLDGSGSGWELRSRRGVCQADRPLADAGDGLVSHAGNGAHRRNGFGSTGQTMAVAEGCGSGLHPDADGQPGQGWSDSERDGHELAIGASGGFGELREPSALRESGQPDGIHETVGHGGGEGLPDAEFEALREAWRRQEGRTIAESGFPSFAPGPDDPRWPAIIAAVPELCPFVVIPSSRDPQEAKPLLRRMAHGLAYRVDRLRACGNGVVDETAVLALNVLSRRFS